MSSVDSPLLGWGTPDEYTALQPLNISSIAYAQFIHVKNGPGLLYGFTIYNSNSAAQFIQLFDSTTKPGSGVIPACVFTVAGSSNLPAQWFPARSFLAGLYIMNSSTGATQTAGSADCFFDVQFL